MLPKLRLMHPSFLKLYEGLLLSFLFCVRRLYVANRLGMHLEFAD